VALTGVADTRFLLVFEFSTLEDKSRIETMMAKELLSGLLAPSIVLTEFLKISGARLGAEAARLRLNRLKDRGMHVLPITEEMALAAGGLLLRHGDVPIADALIASPVQTGEANYVITDDPHFKTLRVRTKWL